jgi:hypothetical protein
MSKFAALKVAKREDRYLPDGYWRADQPKCPHCGHVCDLSANDWWSLCEEGEHEVECPQCQGEFTVSTHVSYSFSTDAQEDLDEDEPSAGEEKAG